ncbi:hypothetical protein acsn021_06060 [Anaerocolumna cellulosilytica]|uniref:Uncharacterized protein n=1 Tax=Anaerocolumna cellulosilytica TaxID=433286 RepID=A0A6S6QYT5_9FIRM|nr:normocyte-binding protein [Anaerocolumna cellulosilytica]MBB5197751.1 hypothetical protein [Anaerocolumna cellulosilytica]BCJ93037.1 hypothetical protein acsn021_06060 [Anaerocolumna cellulosilytica]
MKDMIIEKLSKIQNLEERKLLKDILNGVFVGVVGYNEEMFQKLTKEIFEEIRFDENRYTIYTSLAERNEVDPIHEFLYPMLPEDMQETEYVVKEIQEVLEDRQEYRLMKLFFQCDYLVFKEILAGTERYTGKIRTDKDEYTISISLKQNLEYKACIEELYGNFTRNGVVWTTINSPYVHKFADVMLTGLDKPIKKGEQIKEVTISLGKYDGYKRENMVPLWNIEKLVLPSLTFPVPAMDQINFQHEISLSKSGEEHGYLVILDEEFKGYVKRNKDSMTVCAPVPDITDWKILKVTAYKQANLSYAGYEIMSNKTENSFLNRYARQQTRVIRTKAELYRIISSFEIAKNVEFIDFKIRNSGDKQGETYQMDSFLTDGIREENYKKTLLLEFTAREENYLTRDILSFLVSEIQQYFPEYVCKGKLLIKSDLQEAQEGNVKL